jgi:hypothetical protein
VRDPQRITARNGAGDDLGAALLRCARGDSPSAASRHRAGIAVGVVAGAGAAGTTAATAAAGSSKVAGAGSSVLLSKWIGVAVVSAAIATGAGVSVRSKDDRASPTRVQAASAARAPSAPRPEAAPRLAEGVPSPLVPPSASPTTSSPSAAAGAPTRRAPAPAPKLPAQPVPPTAPSLTGELASVDRARALLGVGDLRGALDALDAHDRAFKGGILAPEADLLRIEALERSGDDGAAEVLARAFLAAFPNSAQERRVRSLLDAIAAKQKP